MSGRRGPHRALTQDIVELRLLLGDAALAVPRPWARWLDVEEELRELSGEALASLRERVRRAIEAERERWVTRAVGTDGSA